MDGVDAKMKRAKDLVSELRREVSVYLDRSPFTSEVEESPAGDLTSEQPPPEISTIIGDAEPLLRPRPTGLSAFLANGAEVTEQTAFPISRDRTRFEDRTLNLGVSEEAKALMEEIEPYSQRAPRKGTAAARRGGKFLEAR